jgi:hypothetical protein
VVALGREAIYASFFKLLETQLVAPGGPFNYGNRRYRAAGQLGASQYPAFFLTEAGEDYDRSVLYAPANVTFFAHVVIQTYDGIDSEVITATESNNLADAVEDAVTAATSRTGQLILGGLVQEAWVNGRQVQIVSTAAAQYSEHVMGIEIVLPRNR